MTLSIDGTGNVGGVTRDNVEGPADTERDGALNGRTVEWQSPEDYYRRSLAKEGKSAEQLKLIIAANKVIGDCLDRGENVNNFKLPLIKRFLEPVALEVGPHRTEPATDVAAPIAELCYWDQVQQEWEAAWVEVSRHEIGDTTVPDVGSTP